MPGVWHSTSRIACMKPKLSEDESHCKALGSTGGQEADPTWMVEARQHGTVEQWFHALVRAHFKGNTKPPFNELAREQAGFTAAWYKPLTV